MIKNLLGKRSRKIGKRGQVTIFIIIGIAIVIIGGLLIVFRDKIPIGNRIGTTQIEPINEYIEECVTKKINEDIKNLRRFGGRDILDFPANPPFSNYNVLNRPYNNLPSLNVIEGTINFNLREYISSGACSLDPFRDNFDISEDLDRLAVSTDIGADSILVKITYPISVQRQDFSAEIEEFNLIIDDNLGKILEISNNIINGDFAGSNFNVAEYCTGDSRIICRSSDNTLGNRVIMIGNEENFPDVDKVGEIGDVFTFVLAR